MKSIIEMMVAALAVIIIAALVWAAWVGMYVDLIALLVAGGILVVGIKLMCKKHGFLSNPYTGGVVVVMVGLLVLGFCLEWEGVGLIAGSVPVAGVVPVVLAVIMYRQGKVEGSDDPYKLRLIKVWDNPVSFDGKGVSVAGTMVEAPYFPLYLSSTQIDMTRKSLVYKDINIISIDEVPMIVEVKVVGFPDEDDLFSFNKSGGWAADSKDGGNSGIYQDWALVINKETENICSTRSMLDMAARSAMVTDDYPPDQDGVHIGLQTRLREWVKRQKQDGQSYGVKDNLIVTADVIIPPAIQEKMNAARAAEFEATQREVSQLGIIKIAEELLIKARAANPDDKMTMVEALDQVTKNSILEQQKLSRVQVESLGTAGSLNVANLHVS